MSLIMLLWFLSLIYPFIVHLVLIMHFVFTFHELGVFVWTEEDRLVIKFFCLLVAMKKVSLCFSCLLCSFLLNFRHFLDLGFHHALERIEARLLSLFPQTALLKMVKYCLSSLTFHVYFSINLVYPRYI
jgi:hypothetical protein